jgi:diguanylate cyclase (GGDEF)-like protein
LAAIFPDRPQLVIEIGSFIVAPLASDEHIVGALSLSAATPNAFNEANLHMLENFAAAAAGALQNALLFQNVERMASIDPLTQQLNRRAFSEVAARELERCRLLGLPAAALLIDLDHFKLINDHYGHPVGDQVLRGFVDRCCERIRKIDVLGRFGGDEFAVLLPRADTSAAAEIAERIRASLEEAPIYTDAGPIQLSVSIGVTVSSSTLPPDTSAADDLNALLRRADVALYIAKEAGRNSLGMA